MPIDYYNEQKEADTLIRKDRNSKGNFCLFLLFGLNLLVIQGFLMCQPLFFKSPIRYHNHGGSN